MLPDRSFLIGQKLVKNAKIQISCKQTAEIRTRNINKQLKISCLAYKLTTFKDLPEGPKIGAEGINFSSVTNKWVLSARKVWQGVCWLNLCNQ